MTDSFNIKSAPGIRKPWRRALVAGSALALALTAARARADDTIVDPELQGLSTEGGEGAVPAAPPPVAVGSSSGAIEDPELAAPPRTPEVTTHKPYARETIWRLDVHTRFGVDTDWASRYQDIVEGTTIASIEAEQRLSDRVLFSVGLRARHAVGFRRDGKARTEFDVAPLSAFVDVTPSDGYHARAGYQIITMGRFDALTATNFLAVYDLRSGPVTMPEAAAIATPALRLDFDKLAGFALQGYYVPFFQPDLVTGYGSNYALPLDRSLDAAYQNSNPDPRASLTSADRSKIVRTSTALLQTLAPAPDFTHPEGALCGTFSGAAGELALTLGTALERIPALGFDADTTDLLIVASQPSASDADRATFLSSLALPGSARLDYNRFWVASADGATDVGPVQLGAEAAFMARRTFYGVSSHLLLPVATRANLLHGGLRVEWVQSAALAAEVEAMIEVPTNHPALPSSPTDARWQNFQNGRWFGAIAGGAQWSPGETPLKFELGGMVFTGPSYVVMPRVEWEAVHTFFLELGAAFVGGAPPPVVLNAPMISLGGLYGNVDQVFVGARFTP